MFESIRSHRRWLMFFMLLLIFPSFVFFGIQGYNRFLADDDAVATVGGEPITPQQLEAAQRDRLEQLRQIFGANFDARAFDTPAARAATLDALLAERALARETARERVAVSEARLREVISSVPTFQQDGRFDYEQYKRILAAQGLSELAFEQRVRDDLGKQTLLQAVSESSFLPKSVVQRLQQSNEELREIRELRFKPEDFAAQVKTTDDAIKSFYESNRTQFETPETVKAEYLVLTLDDIASQIAVPEQELKDYYEQNKTRYGEAEQRRASHILFTVGDKGSAPTKDAARKLAEEVRAQLKANPGDFAKLAREYSKDPGSAANGGDLGFFGRNMMVKPFEEAAFALKQGEVSDVVETDFGFHIIRVTEIKPEQTKPFDAVRADIEREFRRQQAQKKFAEAAEQFTNTVYEQADSLQPAADKLKLKVQTVDSVTRQGASGADPQVFTPAVLSALFSADSIKNRRNTEAIEVGGNTLVSARIADHRPAAMRPLEEVRDAIKARVERAEAARLARETGAKKLEDLRKSPSDTGFGAPRTVGRNESQGLPANAINTIMQVPADKLPTYVGTTLDGDTYAVVRVLSARMPEKVDAERRTAQLRAWAQQLGAADDAAYLDALKNKHKARVLKSDLQPASSAADEDKQSDAK